jgi:molecular chaperone DnaK
VKWRRTTSCWQFDLVGIPPAPRGLPQIEVTFDIDANGIVNVSAKDKATNKEQQIRIQASGGLSDDDIERMVQDAESHADEDKKRRDLVEAKNTADTLLHSAEKNLSEYGDKIGADDKSAIETAIEELKEAKEGEDAEAINAKCEALSQAAMKLGEAMYKAAQEEGEAEGSAEAGSGDADAKSEDSTVVDADFEEVNPDADDAPKGKKDD